MVSESTGKVTDEMQCEKLFTIIDSVEEEYLKIWEEVCNIESPTNCKEGVDAVGRYFIRLAEKSGFEVEIQRQPVSGDAICITMNPDAQGQPVTFSGHTDTVHPVGSFGTPAVRTDDKNIYGPGVMDCKGGVVACYMAMEALKLCGFKDRKVQLILQPDEENSSKTSNKETIAFMLEKAKDSVAFFNTEGCLGDTVVLWRKGILRYKFKVKGKALHSARCPEAANAVAEAAYKIIELEKMKDPDGLTCNCSVISGGDAPNTVPETCSFFADIRFSTNEELESVKKNVKEIADKITVKGCTCELEEISFRPAMVDSEKNTKLLEKMNEIYKENGLPVLTARKTASGSDAAYITQAGIPCVDNIGVDGENIHSVNEYARKKSLKESAKRMAAYTYCI